MNTQSPNNQSPHRNSIQQCEDILSEIAILAEQISRYGPEVVENIPPEENDCDRELATKLACTQRSLAQQIGFMADHAAVLLGSEPFKGDATEWLMSPRHHKLNDDYARDEA